MKCEKYTVDTMPLGWRHFWIASVTGLGQFVGTLVATIAGIIIPLINIVRHPELSWVVQGIIAAADLTGIMVGSVIFGILTDRYGYLKFFRLCPLMVAVAATVSVLMPDVWVLVLCLFTIGLGIGGEYSLDSNYDSVLMPTKWKMVMLGLTKAWSALGNVFGAFWAFLIISGWTSAGNWPDLMWLVAATGGIMLLSRLYFFESPKWLAEHGRVPAAQKALQEFLGKNVALNINTGNANNCPDGKMTLNAWQFIRRNFNKVMLTGVPWMCEGLGVYGIGIFIPVLVLALGMERVAPGSGALGHVVASVHSTFLISLLILPGFLIGMAMLWRKMRETRLQTLGFAACGAALLLLLLSYHLAWPKWISLTAFMAFELFLNVGPHLVTYLLPPKVYPVEVRGQGTGISASIGKAGAVLGVFLVPVLLKAGGAVLVLGVSAGVMLIGAAVTHIYSKKVMHNS